MAEKTHIIDTQLGRFVIVEETRRGDVEDLVASLTQSKLIDLQLQVIAKQTDKSTAVKAGLMTSAYYKTTEDT